MILPLLTSTSPLHLLSSLVRLHPTSTLFPYTTLFRSYGGKTKAPSKSITSSASPRFLPNALNLPFSTKISEASSRSEEHTSELQSRFDLVCRLLLEKKNK